MVKKIKKQQGFTLIELLIVVAIIAILAIIIFTALNPLKRFRDSRDSVRFTEINQIALAVKLHQVDNGGLYMPQISDMATDSVYMISHTTTTSGCNDLNPDCITNVDADNFCVNLEGLVEQGYLGEVPVSPDGEGNWSDIYTGYTLERNLNESITVRACEAEGRSEMEVVW